MSSWGKKIFAFFHLGSMPEQIKSQLESEGLEFLEEHIPTSVSYRNFRAPGKYFLRKSSAAVGSFGLSAQRVVGFAFSREIINVPFAEPQFNRIKFKAEGDKCISASFDAADFNPQHSGQIAMRFHLSNVAEALDRLNSKVS